MGNGLADAASVRPLWPTKLRRFFHRFWHSWWLVHGGNGMVVYQECRVCRTRRAWQRFPHVGVCGINMRWVRGETDRIDGGSEGLKPPQGGSGMAKPKADPKKTAMPRVQTFPP